MALGPTPYPNLQTLNAPTARQVDANSTVQGQLNNIMTSGNPILERAKTRAAQAANKRGLLNTSMGVQAGQEAMLTAATPLAQQDAATFNNQGLTNQTVQNQFNRDSNEYVRQRGLNDQGFRNTYNLSDQGFNQQTGGGTYGSGLIGAELAGKKELLASEQAYGAGQSALDRGFSSGEAQLGREQQQNLLASEQSFGAGQSALGRAQQQNLLASEQSFGAGQSALGRAQQSDLLASEQAFGAGQSALGRTQQSDLLASEQTFGAGQSALGRKFSSDEAELGRTQQSGLLASEQTFGAAQSALGRAQQSDIQQSEQDFSTTQADLGRVQQTALQQAQQDFSSDESALGRAQQLTAINQSHSNSLASAKTAQDYNTANLTMQNGLQKQLVSLGHTNDLGMTKLKADLDTGKLSQEVYANTQGAYLQSVSELVRQTQITVGEIQMKEGISAADKTKMMTDQATLLTAHLTAQKTLFSGSATWKEDWATLPSA